MLANNTQAKFGENNRQHTLELIKNATGEKHFMGTPRVLVDFMEGDFVAATVLNQILYWSDRTNDPNGYFWKTYKQWKEELGFGKSRMMRVIYGDSRTKTRKKILLDVGVEVVHQKAPNGLRVNYYRINEPLFFAQLVDFLEANYGEPLPENQAQSTSDSEEDAVLGITASDTSTQLQIVGADDVENCNADLPKYASQTMPSTQSKLPSLAENTQSQNSSIDDLLKERDLFFLRQDQKIFGELTKNLIKKLKKQVSRLGKAQTKEIIHRCREYGKSWHYVLKALRNENSVSDSEISAEDIPQIQEETPEMIDIFNWEEQQKLAESLRPPNPIINDRIYTLKANETTLHTIWLLAQDRLHYHHEAWMFAQLQFVDCIWETQELIFAAKNKFDRDRAIGHRLFDVAIRDSFGCFGMKDYKITLYTAQEWNDMHQIS